MSLVRPLDEEVLYGRALELMSPTVRFHGDLSNQSPSKVGIESSRRELNSSQAAPEAPLLGSGMDQWHPLGTRRCMRTCAAGSQQ